MTSPELELEHKKAFAAQANNELVQAYKEITGIKSSPHVEVEYTGRTSQEKAGAMEMELNLRDGISSSKKTLYREKTPTGWQYYENAGYNTEKLNPIDSTSSDASVSSYFAVSKRNPQGMQALEELQILLAIKTAEDNIGKYKQELGLNRTGLIGPVVRSLKAATMEGSKRRMSQIMFTKEKEKLSNLQVMLQQLTQT